MQKLLSDFGPSASLGEIAASEAVAIALIVAGLVCYRFRSRLPSGLGVSLFVCAASVGIGVAAFARYEAMKADIAGIARIASALSLLWAVFGCMAGRLADRASADQDHQNRTEAGDASAVEASAPLFHAWALVTGIAATVLLTCIMALAAVSRLDPNEAARLLAWDGAWNFVALLIAAALWRFSGHHPQQPAILLILVAMLAVWTGLMLPSGSGSSAVVFGQGLELPRWWTWTMHVEVALALILVLAAWTQEWRYRARRRGAWPENLDDLLRPYSRWPAYIQAEAVMAAAVLILGVYHIVRPVPTDWQVGAINLVVTASAGLTCLFVSYRRWSGNTAGLGISLLTLAFSVLACMAARLFSDAMATGEYAVRVPLLDNAVLYGLALMIALWSWLAKVWEQQLLNGIAWTTTGRMIPHALRASFLLSAIAALVAFHMALWPEFVTSNAPDDSLSRLIAGVPAMVLLAFGAAKRARRFDSSADATLCMAFVLALLCFVTLRLPASAARGWLVQYEAIVLAVLCIPLLLLAERFQKTVWRSFTMPLWLLALFILPTRALVDLLPSNRLPADWVRPGALAVLGALYLLAGRREHRRAILVLGVVLVIAAATTFVRVYKGAITAYFAG